MITKFVTCSKSAKQLRYSESELDCNFAIGIIVFIMIDQINKLPADGLKSLPETLRYTENKWISQKNQNKLYFLHLIDSGSDPESDSSSASMNLLIFVFFVFFLPSSK